MFATLCGPKRPPYPIHAAQVSHPELGGTSRMRTVETQRPTTPSSRGEMYSSHAAQSMPTSLPRTSSTIPCVTGSKWRMGCCVSGPTLEPYRSWSFRLVAFSCLQSESLIRRSIELDPGLSICACICHADYQSNFQSQDSSMAALSPSTS
jgi:hypothetical protein